MKKSYTIVLMLLLFPIISAVNLEMNSEFNQGETLMARVSGNFLEPLFSENVRLYREHVRLAFEPHVKKIDNVFHIYGQLTGKNTGNYTLVLENIKYQQGLNIIQEDISKDFSIISGFADFSINPGFVETSERFFIEVQNLQNNQITIYVSISDSELISSEEEKFSLNSGNTKRINLNLGQVEEYALTSVTLNSENTTYEIPVGIFPTEITGEEDLFRFEPSELDVSLSTKSDSTYVVYLYNFGNTELSNVSIRISNSLQEFASLSTNVLDNIEPDSKEGIEVFFKSGQTTNYSEGQLIARTGNAYAYASIMLNISESFIPSEEPIAIPESSQTCEQLDGEVCVEGEKCSKNSVYAKDEVCCLGTCEVVSEDISAKIVGWIILAGVVAFVVWFLLKKYKKTKKPLNLLKIASGKKK